MEFENRTAVVTGAGGGMGYAVATALAREGATVTGVDLKERPADLPDACDYLQADITEEGVPEAAVESAARDGRLDFLVNAAGIGWIGHDKSALDISEDVWNRVMDINLHAPMRFARAAVPAMRKAEGAAMVHIASISGLRGMEPEEPMDGYQVSKAALISLSRSLGLQLASSGIRSNTLCPGAVDTPMVADLYAEDPSRRERMAARTPIPRLGQPEDMANACLFLLSERASFITAIDLVVDGGWLAVLR